MFEISTEMLHLQVDFVPLEFEFYPLRASFGSGSRFLVLRLIFGL